MSWNWPRLHRTARRLLSRRHVALEEMATEVVELAPGETVTIPPAMHTPESLERVQKLSPWRDWTTERLLIEGGRQQHAPCLRYRVRDAQLVGAYVYRGAVREEVGYGRESWRAEGPPENLAEAHLMSNFAGSRFFGNYLLDEFPRQLLTEGPAPSIRALGKHFEHEAGYRDLLGLEAPRRVPWARIGELTIYVDYGQNRSKELRFRELRARMRRSIGGGGQRGRVVFLDRGETGERRTIANESQLKAFFVAQGVDVVTPSQLSAEDVARRTLDAALVISVEGSHLSHVIYTVADEGTFLVLQPPDRFAMAYKEFTDRMGLGFAFLVGQPSAEGWSVPLDELARLMDEVRS